MTWTYGGDPAGSILDALRFLLGDTDEDDQQLSDEELNYLLTENDDSVTAAGLSACRRMIAKYSRYVDQKTGDIDTKYSQRLGHYRTLLAMIREGLIPTPYAGGISKSDMEAVQDDEDRQGGQFAVGMQDYPTDIPSGSGGTGGVI